MKALLMPWMVTGGHSNGMYRKELGIPWSYTIQLYKTGYFRYALYIWGGNSGYIGISYSTGIIAMTMSSAMKKADKILVDEKGYELLSQERAEKLELLL